MGLAFFVSWSSRFICIMLGAFSMILFMVSAMAKTITISTDIQKGFTLTELMVVVAIISIITMVAYPSYVGYVRDTERKTAIGKVLEIATRLEQFRTQRFTYPVTAADLAGFASVETKYEYEVAAVDEDGNDIGYSITVSPLGDQVNDDCGTLVYAAVGGWTFDNGLTDEECL